MKQCMSSNLSSVDVVSHCDDLVTQILLRLPLNSVFKFKCVSKTWNRLMSDPIFCCNYKSQQTKNSLNPLLGFFQVALKQRILHLSFLPNCKERNYFSKLDVTGNYLLTHASPEGLILCRLKVRPVVKYYRVFNPIRNQWYALPKSNKAHVPSSLGFSCEEECKCDGVVVHFKVVQAILEQRAANDRLRIETFSSRTGQWSESFLTAPSEFSLARTYGCRSVDGIFFWKISGHLAAYDPNMEENRLRLINLPPHRGREDDYIMGQSPDGYLRFALNDKLIFRVWDLKKKLFSYSLLHIIPSSEWGLKEVVSYNKLNMIDYLPTGTHAPHNRHLNKYPRFMAFHPWNSKLVYLRWGGSMFCYDFETRRLEPVWYRGTVDFTNDSVFPYFKPPWHISLPCLL